MEFKRNLANIREFDAEETANGGMTAKRKLLIFNLRSGSIFSTPPHMKINELDQLALAIHKTIQDA